MTKKVRCTACGKELEIPGELTEYSCVYCGQRIVEANDCLQQTALPELSKCITHFRGFQRRVTASEYVAAFEEYEKGCQDTVRALSGAAPQTLEAAAKQMLDDLQENWVQSSEYKNARKRRMLIGGDKMVLAVFFVPMVRKMKLPISEQFCDILQKQWLARYPKDPFYLGEYEAIVDGFQRKAFGFCFITTAVCRASGLPDDCAELTAFRAFRDGYLRACADGQALIDRYYDIAPGIVTAIELCTDSDKKYEAIRRRYLQPCYEDLQSGNFERCKKRYVQMVQALEGEYLS